MSSSTLVWPNCQSSQPGTKVDPDFKNATANPRICKGGFGYFSAPDFALVVGNLENADDANSSSSPCYGDPDTIYSVQCVIIKNPHKKLPAIDDNGFVLYESAAILKYMAKKYKADDHWYPENLIAQAKLDEYLHWHHSGVRAPCVAVFRLEFMGPKFGKPADQTSIDKAKHILSKALKAFESVYLQKDYILGSKPSIGDLLAYEEIAQLKTTSFDLHGFPAIKAWMARLEELPEYEKPHKILLAVVQKASPKL